MSGHQNVLKDKMEHKTDIEEYRTQASNLSVMLFVCVCAWRNLVSWWSVLCFGGFGLACLGKVCQQCWPNLTSKPSAAMSGPACKASTNFHWSPDYLLLLVVNRPPCLNSSLIFPSVNILSPCATVSTLPQLSRLLVIPATTDLLACSRSFGFPGSLTSLPLCFRKHLSQEFLGSFSVWNI